MDITQCFECEDKAIEYLFTNGLIICTRTCQCTMEMKMSRKKGRLVWTCSNCCTTLSILHGSIFQVTFVDDCSYPIYVRTFGVNL